MSIFQSFKNRNFTYYYTQKLNSHSSISIHILISTNYFSCCEWYFSNNAGPRDIFISRKTYEIPNNEYNYKKSQFAKLISLHASLVVGF